MGAATMLLASLILVSWLAVCTLVVALCVMAKRGDRTVVDASIRIHGAGAPVDVRMAQRASERLLVPVAAALN